MKVWPRASRGAGLALVAGLAIASCSIPPPEAPGPAPRPRPEPAAPATVEPARTGEPLTEAKWRRVLAQHILDANRERVFEGRPPHPLKAVVVLELTIGADGRLKHVAVLRVPAHARGLGAEAVRAARVAEPLPPPPRFLASRGPVHVTETWLYRSDDRFQLRTLAETQLIE